MTLNRYAKRRDANEPEIIKGLQEIGCDVLQCDHPDLIVGYRGRTFIFEVKTATGKLEPRQQKMLLNWRGQYDIVRTLEEAIAVVTKY
jgi:hypothetical protein